MRLQAAFLVHTSKLCLAAVIAVMFTALIAGVASAYRPFDLTDADVATRHYFEIELGPAEFVKVDAERSIRAPNLTLNYGLATGRELVLEGANHVSLESTPDEPRMKLEGLAFAMKQVMRRGSLQDEPGPSIAMEDAILFPERGEKYLGAAVNLIASSASKRGSAHFNIEAERLPEGRNAGSAGLIFESSDHFGVAPAIELRIEAVDGIDHSRSHLRSGPGDRVRRRASPGAKRGRADLRDPGRHDVAGIGARGAAEGRAGIHTAAAALDEPSRSTGREIERGSAYARRERRGRAFGLRRECLPFDRPPFDAGAGALA